MQTAVGEFHRKNGYPIGEKVRTSEAGDANLEQLISDLDNMVESLRTPALYAMKAGDHRLYRLWLKLEETAELAVAFKEHNLTDIADAATDLLYVTVGTFVTYGLPMFALFNEVHRANMTKKRRDKTLDPRMRDKGASYIPPDFKRILNGRSDE